MFGVQIVRDLMKLDSDLIAVVPASRMASGPLPVGAALPALTAARVSGSDLNMPSPGDDRRVTERIQITGLAANYPALMDLMVLVRRAVSDFVGTISGTENVTVHTGPAGPDFMDDEASIYMRSQDFIVGFTEPRDPDPPS